MDNSSVRRVRMVNNRPSLPLDGEDTLPLICALSDFPGADSRTYQAQKNIAAFCRAGINLVACDTNLPLGWYKAAEGDYDALRAELSYVLNANPDAQRCCEDEGVSVLADSEIMMLYTNNAGEKTIRLRNGRTIAHTLPAYTALALDAQTGAVLM